MSIIDLVKQELVRVREELKLRSEQELKALDGNMLERTYSIFGKEYPLLAWSESEPNGSLAVIVELRRKGLFWSVTCYREGFTLSEGLSTDLTERELWEYD